MTSSIKDTDDNVHFLADDVVIYVLKYNSKGELVFDKVGTKTDIREKEFVLYDTVDDDGDYDIVVVWPVLDPK